MWRDDELWIMISLPQSTQTNSAPPQSNMPRIRYPHGPYFDKPLDSVM